jgi:hypothetical protein
MTFAHIYIMYNTCYGGFTLSDAAIDEYKRQCPDGKNPRLFELDRDDQVMAQIVKEMGSAANGQFSDIKLQRIPVDYRDFYTIHEYDGLESVLLNHNVYQLEAIKSLVRDRSPRPTSSRESPPWSARRSRSLGQCNTCCI